MDSPAQARRSPGRPAQLSRDQIVDAASSVADLDTLTMRDLAARLGVSHSALYRWVKNRDELFDLISDVLVDRILTTAETASSGLRSWLARVAWSMHDEFLALPGYASHLSRPHRHNSRSAERLHAAIVTRFGQSGVELEFAEQSYYIFMTSLVSWLAHQESPLHLGPEAPRFDLFLGTLLRGLPAREPGRARPSAVTR